MYVLPVSPDMIMMPLPNHACVLLERGITAESASNAPVHAPVVAPPLRHVLPVLPPNTSTVPLVLALVQQVNGVIIKYVTHARVLAQTALPQLRIAAPVNQDLYFQETSVILVQLLARRVPPIKPRVPRARVVQY